MKNKAKMLVVSALLVGSAQAVTISMDRGTATGMKAITPITGANAQDNTNRVPVGSLISYGTMNGTESSANFVSFATTTMTLTSTAVTAVPGAITLAVDIAGTTPTLSGKQIYMWIYQNPTASSTVNQGLFTSTGWVIPTTFATDPSATSIMVLGQTGATPAAPAISSISIPGLITQATLTQGNVVNSATGTVNSIGNIYQLGQAVPEPSAALLGAIGALGLLRRRRN